MPALKKVLQNKLKDAERIAILGIGSEVRGDDAAGMVVARRLEGHIKDKKIKYLKVFLGATAPENLTGEIKRFKPTHLLMIDAVDINQKAGAVRVIDSYVELGASFSTHKMPIHIMKDYLYQSIGCKSIIIGIQPESLAFCESLSSKIHRCMEKLHIEIISVLCYINPLMS